MSAQQKTNQEPRMLKSRQALCEAIFQLLEEHSFTRITVNNICKVAGVSRTTFYQHFQDKYELIRFALEQATREMQRTSGGSAEREIHNVVDFVYENRNVFRNLDEQNEELFHLLNDISISSLKGSLENTAGLPQGISSELHAVFLAGGRAWLLLWWLKTDCQTPKEQLEDYLVSMLRLLK
jgi:AcrR family transcriptional regulator